MHKNNSQSNTKRSQLRNEIRRKQIEHYFDTTRTKHNQQILTAQKIRIRNYIDTADRKLEWIKQRAAQLRELPTQEWCHVLRLLSLGCGLYRGEYGDWVELGIVTRLVAVVERTGGGNGLAQISACILEEIVYNLPEKTTLIQKILTPNFISALIHHCSQPNLKKSLIYFQLINTILCNRQHLSNSFIQQGLVHFLVNILESPHLLEQRLDDAYIIVTVAYRMIRGVMLFHEDRFGSNVLLVFLPVFGRILGDTDDMDLLRVVLKCFALLAQSQKQYILGELFYSNNLINNLLDFLTSPDQQFLRQSSTNILASLISSSNPTYARQLIQKDILGRVRSCWQFKDNPQQCQNSILKILSNLVSTSLELAKIVLFDEVFGLIVISSARKAQFQNNYVDSLFIVSTMIQYNCTQINEILLRKFYILEILFQGLKYDIIDLQNCLEILQCLICIIQFQKKGGLIRKKKIILELESLYDIQNVLASVQEKLGNKIVQDYVSILLEEMYGEG